MTIDTTIDQYRQTKEKMQVIIDRHMGEAFAEIQQEFGTTPVYVSLDVVSQQTMEEKYPRGIYTGCGVSLGGE